MVVIIVLNIPRIGNKGAFNLIKKHGSIETALPLVNNVPEDYETNYKESRRLFTMYHDTLDYATTNNSSFVQKLR